MCGALSTIFDAVALVLASVGLYAVTAQAVSQRTREIGIRMAVGSVTAVLLVAGVLGCTIPARRVLLEDPVIALRCD